MQALTQGKTDKLNPLTPSILYAALFPREKYPSLYYEENDWGWKASGRMQISPQDFEHAEKITLWLESLQQPQVARPAAAVGVTSSNAVSSAHADAKSDAAAARRSSHTVFAGPGPAAATTEPQRSVGSATTPAMNGARKG